MKKFITIALILMSFIGKAQVDTAGTVFISNDYRSVSSDAIVVKWIALNLYYPNGFHVYRQEKGETDWKQLTTSPLTVAKTVPSNLQAKDPDLKTFIDNVNQIPYQEFQTNIMKVFAAVKAIKSADFAELLGVIYYDESAEKGKSYRYQIKGFTGVKESIINTTDYFTSAKYVPPASPKDITIDRKKKVININWKIEDSRFFGVHVYRSTNGRPFKRITPQARHIQKAPNQKGELVYPPVFFEDYDIEKDEVYTYKLAIVDYFGQEGSQSKEVKLPVVDFDPPLPPTGLKGNVHYTEVKLNWVPQLVEDLAGFNIYRRHSSGEEKKKINNGLMDRVTNNYDDVVDETGIYYYSVAAVDRAGNEAFSGEIIIDVHDVFPPAIPQNVMIVADSGEFILRWDPVQDKDLEGYFVYRSLNDENNEDNEFLVINKAPITSTQYTDKLPKGVRNKFVYTVVAMDTSYNHSEQSEISVVQLPDITPPQAPFIRNIHTEPGSIRIDWLPNHESDLKVYQVYRSSLIDSSNYQLLGEVLPTADNSFEDNTPHPGTEYFYYLKAIDQNGNTSIHSNIYEGLVLDDAGDYIKKELNELNVSEVKTKFNKKKRQIELTWQNKDTPELLGLVIYKGTSEQDLAPLTGLQKITSYNDKDLKGSNSFIYQFRTYDVNGHKIKSKLYSVSVK